MSTAADVIVASTHQDAEAVEAVRRHHAELAAGIAARVDALLAAAETAADVEAPRGDLVRYCEEELLPHALAEEATMYAAGTAAEPLRLLVDGMIAEHRAIVGLVADVAATPSAVRAAAAARALLALFEAHLAKENDLLLPRLAADPAVSLADLLGEMHEHLLASAPAGEAVPDVAPEAAPPHGACECGGHDVGDPVLDVRVIPHAVRHAAVFGAFDVIPAGQGLVIVAPHDPQPLLRQLSERTGGRLQVTYLERGPQAWRLRLSR